MRRTERNPNATSVAPNPRDIDVLLSLSWAAVLSRSQIERLHFPSRRVAQRRMRALFDAGLVRVHVPSERLSDESVFTLSEGGLELLEERDLVERGVVRIPRAPRLQKLAHTLACRQPWIVLRLAERAGSFHLLDYQFDADLADVPECTRAGTIPDGIVALERVLPGATVGRPERVGLWFEVDTGSETTTQLRTRLPAWRALRLTLPGLLGCERVHLLVLVPNDRRKGTVERVLSVAPELGARVLMMGELGPLLASGYPYEVFAPGVRAVRTGFRRAGAEIRGAPALRPPAFRRASPI